ncbi:hypothetical protein [Pigmentiphaga litoralis]|uniref:Uncharacterized protein n=1 Tax=Pigmentiphaga litoralis TaxID=516702 RepID=A0A7Y9IQC5_9BURK|nr:hypothetical protein [Pigmentiphaga litoralis]NYE25381.1 hypothetical protein [Pigmentiphaga litoralis]NYE81007.1 hypothetical protein [Pigmentiphaga litoralis]
MNDIEGIEKAVAALQPHWQEIEADFRYHNERFRKLLAVDHEPIGRILRAHLVIENFLDIFLTIFYVIEEFDDLRLTFAQKAKLLPSRRSSAAFVRPGIIQLNAIRNKFGHEIDHSIENHNLSSIYEVLRHARPNVKFPSQIEAIEGFAAVACAFLSVPPKHLQGLFMKAFAEVRSFNPAA